MWLTFLISSIEKLHYLMTALIVKGILSDLLKCGEGTVHFRMEQFITFCHCMRNVYVALSGNFTNLDCGSSGFLIFGFRSLGTY